MNVAAKIAVTTDTINIYFCERNKFVNSETESNIRINAAVNAKINPLESLYKNLLESISVELKICLVNKKTAIEIRLNMKMPPTTSAISLIKLYPFGSPAWDALTISKNRLRKFDMSKTKTINNKVACETAI